MFPLFLRSSQGADKTQMKEDFHENDYLIIAVLLSF